MSLTLEQLIEACGHIALFWTGKDWCAAKPHQGDGFVSGDSFIDDILGEVGFGKTPEEAVGNLYLILNPIK